MLDEEEIDIFIYDVSTDKKFLFQVQQKMKCIDFLKKLEKYLDTTNIEFRYKGKLYNDNQMISFEEGDIINIYKKEERKSIKNNVIEKENEKFNVIRFSKILHLFHIKYISDRIIDIKKITNDNLRNIISELKDIFELDIDKNNNIKIKTKEKLEHNIILYANYIFSKIEEKEINYLISILEKNITYEIYSFYKLLSNYQQYQSFFEEDLLKALEKSYFEYSVTSIQLLSLNYNIKYFEESKKCPNKINKYLFHEIKNYKPIELINILSFSKKPFYGLGIYFTDQLDYIVYKIRENENKIIPVNSSFICNVSQIYYDSQLKKNISDLSFNAKELENYLTIEEIIEKYPNKKVKKNGLHFVKIKANSGQIIAENDLYNENKNGMFVGNEYIISEIEQILPLFNLEFKRKESLIIWRDPNINSNKSFLKTFKESKLIIYKGLNTNIYFESSIEKALELVKRKKYNKIILVSNIGMDLSGKRFIDIARQILGFPVVILFLSINCSHLNWIKDNYNILYTTDLKVYRKYILNYNEEDIISIKDEIEKIYKIKLTFTKDFLKFPKFLNEKEYKDIIFDEISPNIKKVTIKNIKNLNILCMDEKENIIFVPEKNIKNGSCSYVWHITILGNEITFSINNYYLGIELKDRKIIKDEFMKTWNFVNQSKYYLIHYQNKSHILTDNKNVALIENEKEKNYNQLFILNEIHDDI